MNHIIMGALASLLLAGVVREQTHLISGQPDALLTGDVERGELLYPRRCGACHSTDQNRIGPKHRNVFGRKAGSVEDYSYSNALKEIDVVWTEATLDLWLQNPAKMAPGTTMGFRLTDAQERADIISYLRAASDDAAPALKK